MHLPVACRLPPAERLAWPPGLPGWRGRLGCGFRLRASLAARPQAWAHLAAWPPGLSRPPGPAWPPGLALALCSWVAWKSGAALAAWAAGRGPPGPPGPELWAQNQCFVLTVNVSCRLTALGRQNRWLPGSAGAELAWRQASPGAKQAFHVYIVLSVKPCMINFLTKRPPDKLCCSCTLLRVHLLRRFISTGSH